MIWGIVLILVLLIPILAIIIDSQVGQALAERISAGTRAHHELRPRLEALEAEVRYLNESVERLREETEFLRSLAEGRTDEPRLVSGDGPAGDGSAGEGTGGDAPRGGAGN